VNGRVGEHDADGSGCRGGGGISRTRRRKQRMEIVVQGKGMWTLWRMEGEGKGRLIGGTGAVLAGGIGVGYAGG